MSTSRRRSPRKADEELLSENSRLVHPSFLEKHSNKRDLQKRLKKLLHILQTDESIDPSNTTDWPGLAAVASLLYEEYLDYKPDKEVRLLALACLLELLCLYAPEIPLPDAVPTLFGALTRQLANLATTTQSSQKQYPIYVQMLKLLATYRIGAVLVDCVLQQHHSQGSNSSNSDDEDGQVLEILVDFCHTLLHSVRAEHSSVVLDLTRESLAVLLEEYHHMGVPLPTPVLEELLLAVAPGPTQTVTKLVDNRPKQVPEPNPTYQVAAQLIRAQASRLGTPLAHFLNGLLNADPLLLDTTTILHLPAESPTESTNNADAPNQQPTVHHLIYQLLHISPSILVSVLGTVATQLSSTHNDTRYAAAQLLGQVFSAKPALGERYASIYRAWWQRKADALPPIRLLVIKYGVRLLPDPTALEHLPTLFHDPSKTVRLAIVHHVCDWMYTSDKDQIPVELLQSVRQRFQSKDATERKDAVTGLAQIFGKRYLQQVLQQGSSNSLPPDDPIFSWIPASIWECLAFYTDARDATLRSRLVQLVDDVWWKKVSNARQCAQGWMLVLQDGPWATAFLQPRAALQQTVSSYIDARAQQRKYGSGTEQALAADSKAMECLEAIAKFVPPPGKHSLSQVLEAFHGARDKHIFRILASLADPCHSVKARARALEELPKRVPSIASEWTQQLVRRCAMGSLNATVVQECLILAQEMVQDQENTQAAATVLATVQQITDIFPSLVASSMETLVSLLSECRELKEPDLVTSVTAIMAAASAKADWSPVDRDDLQSELMDLCTKKGTPEQARHAVLTLSRMLQTGQEDNEENKSLMSLLTSLTSPSMLKLHKDDADKTIRILSSLTALVECTPDLFKSTRGKKSITFALETVLMGRGGATSADDSDEEMDTFETPAASKRKSKQRSASRSASRSPKAAHVTPKAVQNILEDDSLSFTCRRVCAAMEFLVAYIRSTILEAVVHRKPHGLTAEFVQHVFELLVQVLRDQGLPPSNRDRKFCRARQDHAALRRCAAVSVFRLCDPRLGLESKLSPSMWHAFSQCMLDGERAVRENLLYELAQFLTGKGVYGKEKSKLPAKPPALRFVALATLCSEGDHGSDYDAANGNAANAGKAATSATKAAVTDCVIDLRKVSDATYAHCRANGESAIQKFETRFKMMIMPEYMVPYALHLLAHRPETPFEDVCSDGSDEDEESVTADSVCDASRQRVLRKRLKLLFEPLVQSLGENADNISFLLGMVDIIAKHYQPIDVSTDYASSLQLASPSASQTGNVYTEKRANILQEKLKVICGAAREVLLSFVKKDINLTPYPGTVHVPGTLFRRTRKASRKTSQTRKSPGSNERVSSQKSPPVPTSILTDRRSSSDRKRRADQQLVSSRQTPTPRGVHFSPEVVQRSRSRREGVFSRDTTPDEGASFGDVSPIEASKSPGSTMGAATLGTTPPSTLLGATLQSTAPEGSTTSEGSPASRTRSSTRSISQSQSPTQSPTQRSTQQSPIVVEQIPKDIGSDDEDEMQTTTETPNTQTQSPPESQETDRELAKESVVSKSVKRTRRNLRRRVPSHIEISRETGDRNLPKKTRRRGSNKSTRAGAGVENRRNRAAEK